MTSSSENDSVALEAGLRLREAREEQGLSLDDVARVTRISRTYLAAIEEGRLHVLPSPTYARGFIRAYSRFLGLDELEFPVCRDEPPTDFEPDNIANPDDLDEAPAGRRPKLVRRYYLLAPVLIAGAAMVLLYSPGGNNAGVNRDISDPGQLTPVAPPPAPIQAARSSEKSTSPPETEATEVETSEAPYDTTSAAEPEGVLQLKALDDAFIYITVDDMPSQFYELKSGDVLEVKGNRLTLQMENGGGFEGQWNGKTIGALGERGVPTQVVLSMKDTR